MKDQVNTSLSAQNPFDKSERAAVARKPWVAPHVIQGTVSETELANGLPTDGGVPPFSHS